MAPKKNDNKNLERILNIRVSSELAEALEETKWTLRKTMSELVRDAIEEYFKRNLKGDIKNKVNEILHKK